MVVKTHNLTQDYYDTSKWREDLLANPLSRKIVAFVEANVDNLGLEMMEAAIDQTPTLGAEMANAPSHIRTRLRAYCDAHAHAFLGVMKNDFDVNRGSFDFIKDYAIIRAHEQYPIAALLAAFRTGRQVCWDMVCRPIGLPSQPMLPSTWRVVMGLSVFTMEYTDRISSVLATAYGDETLHIQRVATHGRGEFLEALLAGNTDAAITQKARQYALDPDGHFIVFTAQLAAQDSETSDDHLVDAVRRLEQLLGAYCKQALIEVRRGASIGVLGVRPEFDEDLETLLDRSSDKWMGGQSFLVGISSARRGLENVQHGYQDAQHALSHATPQAAVMRFCNISVFDHLVATAGSSAYRIRPSWLAALVAEDARMKGVLLDTLRVFVNSNLSPKLTADTLSVHTNTIYHRLRKVEEITRISPKNLPGLLNTIAVLKLHPLEKK